MPKYYPESRTSANVANCYVLQRNEMLIYSIESKKEFVQL